METTTMDFIGTTIYALRVGQKKADVQNPESCCPAWPVLGAQAGEAAWHFELKVCSVISVADPRRIIFFI